MPLIDKHAINKNIIEHFDKKTYVQGFAYFQQDRVKTFSVSDAQDNACIYIEGSVKSTQHLRYASVICIQDDNTITSQCSCPRRQHCKHVVALLLTAMNYTQPSATETITIKNISQLPIVPKPSLRPKTSVETPNKHSDVTTINPWRNPPPTTHEHVLYGYVQIDEDDEWYSNIIESSDYQWFDLELGIILNGEQINILPLLLKTIQRLPNQFTPEAINSAHANTTISMRLSDGRELLLPMQRLKSILSVLTELYDDTTQLKAGKLHLSALRSIQLAELAKAAGKAARFRWLGGQRLLELGERLQHFQGMHHINPPADFKTTLRPYQQEGLNWLQFLSEYQLGGILADDMGLGKTVQALAHILAEKHNGRMMQPCLVIVPTSLLFNWRMEAEKFAPALRVLTLHGKTRKEFFPTIKNYDLILTTYPLLVRDHAFLEKQHYHLLILDEAQIIKNPNTKVTKIVQFLKTEHRLCLTGTPMENHLSELWSLFHFLMPGLLGDSRQFQRIFRTPIEKHKDMDRSNSLAKRIAPFMLRRTKHAVLKELPDKIELIRNIELEGTQRDLYETVRLAMHQKVADVIQQKSVAKSQIIILDALLKLRQICCDPRLLKIHNPLKAHATSAKLNLLMEMLPTLLEEGRQILLFSQFTEMLGLIEERVKSAAIPYVKLTGETINREQPIRQFQQSKIKLFLISLKAGGVGLNLTAADTVIHYDPWWNPAVEQQATDRAHRIGQMKTVLVYKLITVGTVEEKILLMQEKKRALLKELFNNEAAHKSSFTGEDLTELFSGTMD